MVPQAGTHLCGRLTESVVAVFLGSLLLAIVLRYSGLFPSVVNWDESLYVVIAQHWLLGELPFDAVWDQHSIGLPALFAAILSIAPHSLLAIRLSACVAVAVTATALYITARMIDRRAIPGILAVILYTFWTARWWGQAANTELYINALTAVAMCLLIGNMVHPTDSDRRVRRMSLAALLLGIAVHVKHVAVAETLLFFAVLWFGAGRGAGRLSGRGLATVAAAFCLPSIIVLDYFWSAGLAYEYLNAVIGSNLTYVVDRASLADIWPGLPKSVFLPLVIAAIVTALTVKRPSPPVVLLLLWQLAALVDVALPGKFWDHYFLLLMPAGAALGGHLAARVSEKRAWVRAFAVPAAVVLGNPFGVASDAVKAHGYAERDVPRMIADRLAPLITPADSIFVFNYQPVLYFLTEADLPTRYVQPDALSRRFAPVSGALPLRELDAVFAKQPKFVVFVEPDWLRMGDEVFAALRGHLAGYEKDFEVVDRQLLPQPVPVQVYRRKDARTDG